MLRFLAGFGLASLLWGGFIFAYSRGYIDISLEPEAPPEAAPVAGPDDGESGKPEQARRRRTGLRKPHGAGVRTGNSTSGDDLGENDTRNLDVGAAGGEEQLKSSEIEQGFDSVFSQVRRCLVLAASDEAVSGKLIFGLRIAGDGHVAAVNLSGPSALTQGDAGACLRKAATGMHFRAFHGPDMVVRYPLTLE